MDKRLQSFAEYMVADWNGRITSRIGNFGLNFDGRYGTQCMDLFNWVWTELGIPSAAITRTYDAAGVWELGPEEDIWEFFDRVGPDQKFQPADIFVFNRNAFNAQGRGAGNGYGHIGMVIQDLGNDTFEVLEANGLGDGYEDEYLNQYGSPARIHIWSKKDLYGVLRPKPEKCPGLEQFNHEQETAMVASPNFIWRGAAEGNFGYGRRLRRDGRFTFHHVVGPAESAAATFATPGRQASATFTVTEIPGVIFQHVSMDNTPYSDGNADSNAMTISAEHHGDWRFGYRNEQVILNSAHLVAWLRQEGIITHSYRHWQVSLEGTACSCDLPVEEIWNLATSMLNGGTAPKPITPPQAVPIEYRAYSEPVEYIMQADPTTLWRFDKTGWDQFGTGSKTFPKGTRILIYGEGHNAVLNATYLLTEFSLTSKVPNGFNKKDLVVAPKSAVVQTTKLNKPVEFVLAKDANLWDFNHESWGDVKAVKAFKKGDRVLGYARAVNTTLGATYILSQFSFDSKLTHGFNERDLTVYVAPPTPKPVPSIPEWQRNLRPAAAPKLIVTVPQTPVVDLVSGKTIKQLGQGTVIDVAQETTAAGIDYILSAWSAANSAGQGIRKADLAVPLAPIDKPKWLQGWKDIEDVDMYVRADTNVWNLVDSTVVKQLKRGEKVRIASTSDVFGQRYALTAYSTGLMLGNGIRLDDLDLKPVEDNPPATKPIPTEPETVEQRLSWLEKALAALGIKK